MSNIYNIDISSFTAVLLGEGIILPGIYITVCFHVSPHQCASMFSINIIYNPRSLFNVVDITIPLAINKKISIS